MSDDWDTVTKIGKNVRSGGGADREKVLRDPKAVAAAKRSGADIATEKKFAVSFPSTVISNIS
jgi:putative transcription factor